MLATKIADIFYEICSSKETIICNIIVKQLIASILAIHGKVLVAGAGTAAGVVSVGSGQGLLHFGHNWLPEAKLRPPAKLVRPL